MTHRKYTAAPHSSIPLNHLHSLIMFIILLDFVHKIDYSICAQKNQDVF
mgnify:CR=1 FL=1